ncbi:YdeI/OmpD-associated family protein [Clostridium nigeriense]|uniref:YdeI/OmpD-associated family protein n=1 Tax=Clostridium nigeriense TaxID=1805470 RepID=UPI003D343C5D
MKKYSFIAEIKKHEGKDATYIEVPLDIEKEFGAKRIKVKVKFDNVDYRGSVVKMGLPCYMIGITKEIRSKIGKTYGDIISVELEKDEEERVIELPIEFKEKLIQNDVAYKFYESLSYSQQRKYYQWITSAKKDETKIKRMEEAIEKLKNSVKL